jgi:hypothetical protein
MNGAILSDYDRRHYRSLYDGHSPAHIRRAPLSTLANREEDGLSRCACVISVRTRRPPDSRLLSGVERLAGA